ncbi:MAG: DUF6797 domain-containing protein [Planctomycetota bacterium]
MTAEIRETPENIRQARVRLKGDPRKGALVYFRSAAACAKCHEADDTGHAIGPSLAQLGQTLESLGDDAKIDYLVESILEPSAKIRDAYASYRILTFDGQVITGVMVDQDDDRVVVRNPAKLDETQTVLRDDIDQIQKSKLSAMPAGLCDSLLREEAFYDLVAYLNAVAEGGEQAAVALRPGDDELVIRDDTKNLDHAGILRSMDQDDFVAGKAIYNGHCRNCHGDDGNNATLAAARAFGKDPMKYGGDPYRMVQTVSRGAGLMAALTHLSPRERYQVVHYVREGLMKGRNPAYQTINDAYLDSLPKGTDRGEREEIIERDYGPVLASQLGDDVQHALTFRLPQDVAVSYDLHRMRLANVTVDGFLDLSETQHQRMRGEGMPEPEGTPVRGLRHWAWAIGRSFDVDPLRVTPRGPIRGDLLKYRGHYLHDDRAILSYRIADCDILETLDSTRGDTTGLTLVHTLELGPTGNELLLQVGKASAAGRLRVEAISGDSKAFPMGTRAWLQSNRAARVGDSMFAAAQAFGDLRNMDWQTDNAGRLLVRIQPSDQVRRIHLVRREVENLYDVAAFESPPAGLLDTLPKSLVKLTRGGATRWPETIPVTGRLGADVNGYALDTIPVPFENPWNAWMRTSGLDFLSDGRAVVSTHGGDVYLVSGIDSTLENVTWKRFAAGLFEPFGVRVVDDKIYVTCRDGIRRLQDFDHNDEADFVEVFWADEDVSCKFHAYNFALQTDSKGNFYFAKAGQFTDYGRPGTIMKLPPEGGAVEVVAWGLRTPNGMGAMPGDRFTVSDNQGAWMPAGKVSLIRPGAFFGNMPQNSRQDAWLKSKHGGRLPESFDQPMIWMPQELDNSSGGQLWVEDDRFGPLAERLLHSSYGQGTVNVMYLQEFGDITQAAITPLPFKWNAGVMRMRTSPADGQLYGVGLSGWQGPFNSDDGCLQRMRYTGSPVQMLDEFKVINDGIRLRWNFPVDPNTALDPESYEAEMWNYRWTQRYGSDQFSVRRPKQEGHDSVRVAAVRQIDASTVELVMPGLSVCDQLRLDVVMRDDSGRAYIENLHATIHVIPSR